MTLLRVDPFRDLRGLQSNFDRLLAEASSRRAAEGEDGPKSAAWEPAVDVHENGTALTLRAELPGMSENDIELTVDKGRLTFQGEKQLEKEDTDGEYRRVESSYGTFYRSFPLPDSVDQDNIEAEFKNGVLTVELPKVEAAKLKRIALSIN